MAFGEVIAVATLPASLQIDTKVAPVGALLTGGEAVVQAVSATPQFTMRLLPEQAAMIPASATLSVHGENETWPAVIASRSEAEDGSTVLTLTAPDGGPVCANACDAIAASTSNLVTEVQVVPEASGPAVPVSAITTGSDGSASVQVVRDGQPDEPRVVTIKGSARGIAVVEGVAPGERVRALADDATSVSDAASETDATGEAVISSSPDR